MSSLVIIESPGKIKKISQILGPEYIIRATHGHIMSIPTNKFSVDLTTYIPKYIYTPKNKNILTTLKSDSKNTKNIYLATDPDRAGERIAYDVSTYLNLHNVKRLTFHEITKSAILKSINNSSTLNMNMVDSQKAQETLDYIIGLKISPLMNKFLGTFALGAGRCMSVYTRLIYDKYIKYKDKKLTQQEKKYKIIGKFECGTNSFEAILNKQLNKNNVLSFIKCTKYADYKISNIKISTKEIYPHPPLNTLEMQKLASSILHFTPKMTMNIAQKLYEKGIISYIRTDSIILPEEIINDIKTLIPENYFYNNKYNTKFKYSQEGHSAIYPIHINISNPQVNDPELKLYTLIRNYTLASQMKPAINKIYTFDITINTNNKQCMIPFICNFISTLKHNINTIKDIQNLYYKSTITKQIFDGFMKIFNKQNINDQNDIIFDNLKFIGIKAEENNPNNISYYSESSLISKIEKLEIGRPSTIASLIEKIQKNGYVKKDTVDNGIFNKNTILYTAQSNELNFLFENIPLIQYNKFIITDLGIKTTKYLLKYFGTIMDYDFTAYMENQLLLISENKDTYYNVLNKFYTILSQYLLSASKINNPISNNQVGKYNNIPVILKYGKYGSYLCCGKMKYSLSKSKINIDNITQEFINDVFNTIEQQQNYSYNSLPINIKAGRYGKYIEYDNNKISIPDNYDISEQSIIKLIKDNEPKYIGKYKIFNGLYGYYIKYNNKNISIKKLGDINNITEEDITTLIK